MKEAQVKRRCDDFTLVELLVVICLASLLFGIVLPAFSRMVTGSAVDRLSSNLKLRLEQTQSQAAVSRRPTALILPNGTDTVWTDSQEKAARLGGSRMCYVDNVNISSSPPSADFKSWVPNEDWTRPERGAFLVRITDTPQYSNEDDPTKTKGVAAEGGLQHVGNGTNSGANTVAAENSTALLTINSYNGGAARSSCAVVYSPNGNMRNQKDIYLVVAEAMINGSKLIFPGGGDAGAHNFRALKINHITGRVEYYR